MLLPKSIPRYLPCCAKEMFGGADQGMLGDAVDDGVDDDDEEERSERASLLNAPVYLNGDVREEGEGEENSKVCKKSCNTVAEPGGEADVSEELEEE